MSPLQQALFSFRACGAVYSFLSNKKTSHDETFTLKTQPELALYNSISNSGWVFK